jgi:hypothetical protein
LIGFAHPIQRFNELVGDINDRSHKSHHTSTSDIKKRFLLGCIKTSEEENQVFGEFFDPDSIDKRRLSAYGQGALDSNEHSHGPPSNTWRPSHPPTTAVRLLLQR